MPIPTSITVKFIQMNSKCGLCEYLVFKNGVLMCNTAQKLVTTILVNINTITINLSRPANKVYKNLN